MWAAIPLSALPSPPRRSGGGCGPSATEPAGLRSWLCGAEFVLHDLVVQAPALARPAIDMDREREASFRRGYCDVAAAMQVEHRELLAPRGHRHHRRVGVLPQF